MEKKNSVEITIPIIEAISFELDKKYNLIQSTVDIHAGDQLYMSFKDSVDNAFSVLKRALDEALRNIRSSGEAIYEEVYAKFCYTYDTMMKSVGERGEELIRRLSGLLHDWRTRLYEHIMKSIPRNIDLNDGKYELQSITLIRSVEIGGSITSSVSSLFSFTVKGNMDIQTNYHWLNMAD